MNEPNRSPPPLQEEAMTATTTEQVAAFERDGFIAVPQLLSKAEVEALRRRTEQIIMGEVPMPPEFQRCVQIEPSLEGRELAGKERLRAVRKMWSLAQFDPLFESLVYHPNIV